MVLLINKPIFSSYNLCSHFRLLHQAALWDNAELLEDLLNGEELEYINSCDSWGRSPVHAATTTESSMCLRILIQVIIISFSLSHARLITRLELPSTLRVAQEVRAELPSTLLLNMDMWAMHKLL
jgi:hypothetical protein